MHKLQSEITTLVFLADKFVAIHKSLLKMSQENDMDLACLEDTAGWVQDAIDALEPEIQRRVDEVDGDTHDQMEEGRRAGITDKGWEDPLFRGFREEAIKNIRWVLKTIDEAGFAVVPKEPTEEMIAALYGPYLGCVSNKHRKLGWDDALAVAPEVT